MDKNLSAFLYMVAACEGTAGPNGYRMMFGGGLFDSFDDHPRVKFWEKDDEFIANGKKDYTTAAGIGQITATTWDLLRDKYPGELPDFTPASQDRARVLLVQEAGAYEDVLAGRLVPAINKLGNIWASLPSSKYPQPKRTLAYCRRVFKEQGGVEAESDTQPAAPIEDRSTPYTPTKESAMPVPIAALIAAFGPMIIELIPQVAKLFKPSERGVQNADAAVAVINTIVKASGETNLQTALDEMQKDPALKEEVTKAVLTDPVIMAVLEIGGGIQKAREANLEVIKADVPLYRNPALIITLLVLPLVYIVTMSVLFGSDDPVTSFWGGFWGPGFMAETRSATVNLILGMVLGGVMGYFFGTTFGSARTTAALTHELDKPR